MNTFKSYLLKETFELIRTYKLLIILITGLAFSISGPITLFFTPKILASQFKNVSFDISELIVTGHLVSVQSYLGDAYQILGLVILILFFKSLISEFKTKKIIIPFMSGANLRTIIFAKFITYVFFTNLIVIFSVFLNYLYGGLVFDEFVATPEMTLHGTLSLIIFIDLNLALILLISSYIKNTFLVVSLTLINYLVLPSLFNIFKFMKYSPFRLLEAISLTPFNISSNYSILLTFILIILILLVASRRIIRFHI